MVLPCVLRVSLCWIDYIASNLVFFLVNCSAVLTTKLYSICCIPTIQPWIFSLICVAERPHAPAGCLACHLAQALEVIHNIIFLAALLPRYPPRLCTLLADIPCWHGTIVCPALSCNGYKMCTCAAFLLVEDLFAHLSIKVTFFWNYADFSLLSFLFEWNFLL